MVLPFKCKQNMTEIEKIIEDLALDKESKNQLKLKLEIFSEEQKLNTKKLISKSIDYFMLLDAMFLLGSDDKDFDKSIKAVNESKTDLIYLIRSISEKLK